MTTSNDPMLQFLVDLERLVSATNDLVVEPGSTAPPLSSGRTIRDAG
jgi:hypothetical protein